MYTQLNKTILSFKSNYKSFKNSINNLKNLGLTNEEINKNIEILIKNMNNNDIFNILNKIIKVVEVKTELINLMPVLFPFINNEIEALKANVEVFLIQIKQSEQECKKCIEECFKHKHSFKKRNHYFLCSTTIRKIEEIIYSN